MKSVKRHSKVSRLIIQGLVFGFLFSINLFAQQPDAEKGKQLFNANCAACHKLEAKLIGPALKGITDIRDQKWLISWVKNSAEMIKSGDKNAVQIFEEFNKMPMPAQPQLSDLDIVDILEYTKGEPVKVATTSSSQSIDPGVGKGKQIFNANCAACHKLDVQLIGPALFKIGERQDAAWLHKWIRNNAELIASGDKTAIELSKKYPAAMPAFPQLSDEDIDNVLKYLNVGDIKPTTTAGLTDTDQQIFNKPGFGVLPMLGITILAFALLSFIIASIYRKKTPEELEEESIVKAIFKSSFVRFLLIIFILLGSAYWLFASLLQIDVNEGYQPIQPITFSHAVHAGDNKIDCQYCHSSAKHSKTSGIPSVNVCMNCHKSISEYKGKLFDGHSKEFFDNEIQKIYDAIGWDKTNMKYIEGYKQKPIQWVRIHNLPDFAYFNHSQHVTVGGVACQKCHGPVETMNEVAQNQKLTMGWCINCHKATEVDLKNDYYQKIHEQLSKKYGIEKVTEAQMGGLECGKCHY